MKSNQCVLVIRFNGKKMTVPEADIATSTSALLKSIQDDMMVRVCVCLYLYSVQFKNIVVF